MGLLPAQFLDQLIGVLAGQSAQARTKPTEWKLVSWSAARAIVNTLINFDLTSPAGLASHWVMMRGFGMSCKQLSNGD